MGIEAVCRMDLELRSEDVELYWSMPEWARREIGGKFPAWQWSGNEVIGWQWTSRGGWERVGRSVDPGSMLGSPMFISMPVELQDYLDMACRIMDLRENVPMKVIQDGDLYMLSFKSYTVVSDRIWALGLRLIHRIAEDIMSHNPSLTGLENVENVFYDRDGEWSIEVSSDGIIWTHPYRYFFDSGIYDNREGGHSFTETLLGTIELLEGTARIYTNYGVTEDDIEERKKNGNYLGGICIDSSLLVSEYDMSGPSLEWK